MTATACLHYDTQETSNARIVQRRFWPNMIIVLCVVGCCCVGGNASCVPDILPDGTCNVNRCCEDTGFGKPDTIYVCGTTCCGQVCPTKAPSSAPTRKPTTLVPTVSPSPAPTRIPSHIPTPTPTTFPISSVPTTIPTHTPTKAPLSSVPTSSPSTQAPTHSPSTTPTSVPTMHPTSSPTAPPTHSPTTAPSNGPTFTADYNETECQILSHHCCDPNLWYRQVWRASCPTTCQTSMSCSPTTSPTTTPTSSFPTTVPTELPSTSPTTSLPTVTPTVTPTNSPTTPPTTSDPTRVPSLAPTVSAPTSAPTCVPDIGAAAVCTQAKCCDADPLIRAQAVQVECIATCCAVTCPSPCLPNLLMGACRVDFCCNTNPTNETAYRHLCSTTCCGVTCSPSSSPTAAPSSSSPTLSPTLSPTQSPTRSPTLSPSRFPSTSPSSSAPTTHPTSSAPTTSPTTASPSTSPTPSPTWIPTLAPTLSSPTVSPSSIPTTSSPTSKPSALPTSHPPTISAPTLTPTSSPTVYPTSSPSTSPTPCPRDQFTSCTLAACCNKVPSTTFFVKRFCASTCCAVGCTPTASPTTPPTHVPTSRPTTSQPTTAPSMLPTTPPTLSPSSNTPTHSPSMVPTVTSPSAHPSVFPTPTPTSAAPSTTPTIHPTTVPSRFPTSLPSALPTLVPSTIPSQSPTLSPSCGVDVFNKCERIRCCEGNTIAQITAYQFLCRNTCCQTSCPTIVAPTSPLVVRPVPTTTPSHAPLAPCADDVLDTCSPDRCCVDYGFDIKLLCPSSCCHVPCPTLTTSITTATPSIITAIPSTTTAIPTTSDTVVPLRCPDECGTRDNGGGTCSKTGKCTSCDSHKLRVRGLCVVTLTCKANKVYFGKLVNKPCRCADRHCHICKKTGPIIQECKKCRDGYYLLNKQCVETCPPEMTSSGFSVYGRKCLPPFVCQRNKVVYPLSITASCKCPGVGNTPGGNCQRCEFKAGGVGDVCHKCNSGKFLHNNVCRDNCDGINGFISYGVGDNGRQCRPPFTCARGLDEDDVQCKCPLVGGVKCLICEWQLNKTVCLKETR